MKRLNIALLVGDIRDIYSNTLTKGALRASKEYDCNLLIVPGRYYQASKEMLYEEFEYQFQTLFSYFMKENIDLVIACTGVVGISASSDSRNSLEKFCSKMKGIPFITVSGDSKEIPNICYDNKTGILEGMDCMINKHGCKKLAMVAGPVDNIDSNERIEAFKESLMSNGLPIDERLIIHSNFTEKCFGEVMNLMKSYKGIDGIVFANDRMAIGGYEAFKNLDIVVGRDISVFGFDNIEKDINLDPPLASVSADAEEIGYQSVLFALDYYKDRVVTNKVLPTKFIMRNSVLRGEGKNFKEQNADNVIDSNTDFDTFAKQSFLNVYVPTINEDKKEVIYRKYLLLILEIEKLYRAEKVTTKQLRDLVVCFNRLFEADTNNELDIGRMTLVFEAVKEAILSNNPSNEKKETITFVSAYVYRRLASILTLRESATNYALKKMQHEIYRISADMMLFDECLDNGYASILSNFEKIGIKHSFLYLFKNPIENDIDDNFKIDEFVYLKSVQCGNQIEALTDRNQMIPVAEMFDNAFSYMKDSGHLVMLNLYVGKMIYGVLLCDIPFENFTFYESLIYQVSSAIRLLQLLNENAEKTKQLNDTLEIIKQKNIKLDKLSKSDELTGINNRRGFLLEADKILNSSIKDKSRSQYVVVGYADTDNMKGINDKFGHEEGDRAIIASSEVIKKALGRKGTFGRMGGDEFAFIFKTNDKGDVDKFRTKFEEELEFMNIKLKDKYPFSMSLGIDVYEYDCNLDINRLLDSADVQMYHIKRDRHKERKE